jgi:predicted MFS family arabinose efflux permease
VCAVARNHDLALLVGLTSVQTFTRGALTVFTVVVALDLLRMGESGVGTLAAAVGAGAVLGSGAVSLLVGTRRLGSWFGLGIAFWGLPIALIGFFPTKAVTLSLLVAVGVANTLVDLGVLTLMARLTPDDVLARGGRRSVGHRLVQCAACPHRDRHTLPTGCCSGMASAAPSGSVH